MFLEEKFKRRNTTPLISAKITRESEETTRRNFVIGEYVMKTISERAEKGNVVVICLTKSTLRTLLDEGESRTRGDAKTRFPAEYLLECWWCWCLSLSVGGVS